MNEDRREAAMLRNAGVQARVLAYLAVPALAFVLVTGALGAHALGGYASARRDGGMVEAAGDLQPLLAALTAERALTVARAGGDATAKQRLPAARAAVNSRAATVLAAASADDLASLPPQVAALQDSVRRGVVSLTALRTAVDSGGGGVDQVAASFDNLVAGTVVVTGVLADAVADPAPSSTLDIAFLLQQAADADARERLYGLLLLAPPPETTGALTAAREQRYRLAVAQDAAALGQFRARATASRVTQLGTTLAGLGKDFATRQAALSSAGTRSSVTTDDWTTSATARLNRLDSFSGALTADAVQTSSDRSSGARNQLLLVAFVLLLGAGATVVAGLAAVREIVHPLRRLEALLGGLLRDLPLIADGVSTDPDGSAADAAGSAADDDGPAADDDGPAVDADGPAMDAAGSAMDAAGSAVDAAGSAAGGEDSGPGVVPGATTRAGASAAALASSFRAQWTRLSRRRDVEVSAAPAAQADQADEADRVPGEIAVDVPAVHAERPGDEIARLTASAEELGEVAGSMARVLAGLRSGVAHAFVDVAHRNQALVSRQLSLIEMLADEEDDPEVRDQILRLDRLAIRMRRNAESLLVLADADAGREGAKSSDLASVIRTACEETEFPDRVSVSLDVDRTVVAGMSFSAVHLVAELIENAGTYSDPTTPIIVTAVPDESGSGVRITVTDSGRGMSEEQYAQANAVLASPTREHLLRGTWLGILVVGRLGVALGARITMAAGHEGGVVVTVDLPEALFVSGYDPSEGSGIIIPETFAAYEGIRRVRLSDRPAAPSAVPLARLHAGVLDLGVHDLGVHDLDVHDLDVHDLDVHDLGDHDLGSHDLADSSFDADDVRVDDVRVDDVRVDDVRVDDVRGDDVRVDDFHADDVRGDDAYAYHSYGTDPYGEDESYGMDGDPYGVRGAGDVGDRRQPRSAGVQEFRYTDEVARPAPFVTPAPVHHDPDADPDLESDDSGDAFVDGLFPGQPAVQVPRSPGGAREPSARPAARSGAPVAAYDSFATAPAYDSFATGARPDAPSGPPGRAAGYDSFATGSRPAAPSAQPGPSAPAGPPAPVAPYDSFVPAAPRGPVSSGVPAPRQSAHDTSAPVAPYDSFATAVPYSAAAGGGVSPGFPERSRSLPADPRDVAPSEAPAAGRRIETVDDGTPVPGQVADARPAALDVLPQGRRDRSLLRPRRVRRETHGDPATGPAADPDEGQS